MLRILLSLRIVQGTDTVRWQLTALCCTTSEFKRLSKHYTRETHNNGQRSNKRHKVRETVSERDGKRLVRQRQRRERVRSIEKKDGRHREGEAGKSIDFYMQN